MTDTSKRLPYPVLPIPRPAKTIREDRAYE